MSNRKDNFILKILLTFALIGFIFFPRSVETTYGCDFHSWDFFMDGSQFVIGVVISIDESEVSIEVTDSFAPHFTPSESLIEISDVVYFPSDRWQRFERLKQGDHVVASLTSECPCCERDGSIFHVTSLDYATLQVVEEPGGSTLRMLTDFVNHRAIYTHRFNSLRVYRQHRQNPIGFTLAYDPTSLILGEITSLEQGEITIEIWDYITPDGAELAFDHLRWSWDDENEFTRFNVGDDIAVNLWLPSGDGESRTLTATSMTIFSINVLDDGSIQLERGNDASLSALFTDLIQHRRYYPYVVTFAGSHQHRRYQSVARLVDGELIMIYGQQIIVEERVENTNVIEDEFLTPRDPGFDWATIAFATVGIGGVLGVAMVVLVVKIRKQVLSDEKKKRTD